MPAELREQPGFPDAGLADEPHRLAMPVLDLAKGVVQNRQLAVAIDKSRGGPGRGLVDARSADAKRRAGDTPMIGSLLPLRVSGPTGSTRA